MIKDKKQRLNAVIIALMLLSSPVIIAQQGNSLNIDSCYAMAERNYPLVNQYALIEKSKDYSVSNVSKGYLPQFGISGQATYQSDVTEIPISLPNVTFPEISKDQYKIYAEVTQPLTDLLTVKHNKELVKANAETERKKVEVEFYKLKERINQLYFGILLIDAQIQQAELMKKDIQAGLDKTNTAIENGIALKSNADILKAELLKANQRTIEFNAMRQGYTDMLSLFINQTIDETTVFEKPLVIALSTTINRPELNLFETQKKVFDIHDKLITAKNLPRFSLFLQGGYGRPALNFLDNDFSAYYIGGVRLNWNISGLYTYGKEKKNLAINKDLISVQEDLFLFNINLTLKQQNAEITKLQELIATDDDIIQLRENVKNATKNQLENGTATTNDYISHINAEDQAKQNRLLHQIQLLMAQYNHKTTTGN